MEETHLLERLVKIETKLDMFLEPHRATQEDHEERLRSLERKLWLATGLATVLSGGGATLLQNLIGG